MNDLFGEITKVNDSNLTPLQRKQQLEQQAKSLANLAETLEQLAKTADRSGLNAIAHKVTVGVEQLIGAARNAHATGADPDRVLLNATKGVADAIKALLKAAEASAANPNDNDAKEALMRAQQGTSLPYTSFLPISIYIYPLYPYHYKIFLRTRPYSLLLLPLVVVASLFKLAILFSLFRLHLRIALRFDNLRIQ